MLSHCIIPVYFFAKLSRPTANEKPKAAEVRITVEVKSQLEGFIFTHTMCSSPSYSLGFPMETAKSLTTGT